MLRFFAAGVNNNSTANSQDGDRDYLLHRGKTYRLRRNIRQCIEHTSDPLCCRCAGALADFLIISISRSCERAHFSMLSRNKLMRIMLVRTTSCPSEFTSFGAVQDGTASITRYRIDIAAVVNHGSCVPDPCSYSTVKNDRRKFQSKLYGEIQTCGEGLEFDDDDDMCTCIVVSASMTCSRTDINLQIVPHCNQHLKFNTTNRLYAVLTFQKYIYICHANN